MRMRVWRACVSKLGVTAQVLASAVSVLAGALQGGFRGAASACMGVSAAGAAELSAALPAEPAQSEAGRMIVSRMYASDTSRSYSSPWLEHEDEKAR